MIVVHCVYCLPRCGDVALLSATWRDHDADTGEQFFHVPVVGNTPWWHWMAHVPMLVQQTVRATYQEWEAHRESGEAW